MTGTRLVIIGAGGFGREVLDIVEAINARQATGTAAAFDFLGFLDDGAPDAHLLDQHGARHLGPVRMLEELGQDVQYLIGIGQGPLRRKVDEWASSIGVQPATAIHPAATFGRPVRVDAGVIVASHVSVTTNVTLGRHVHLNLNCTVGHDSVLCDYVTVNPGATISGNVTLEPEVTIGTGAAIIQGLTIRRGAVIGAAAGVVRDIPDGVTAVGVPARPRL